MKKQKQNLEICRFTILFFFIVDFGTRCDDCALSTLFKFLYLSLFPVLIYRIYTYIEARVYVYVCARVRVNRLVLCFHSNQSSENNLARSLNIMIHNMGRFTQRLSKNTLCCFSPGHNVTNENRWVHGARN